MRFFLGLMARCKDEPYVKEFVDYYLNQGVDKIFLIDDNSDQRIYKDVINNIDVIIDRHKAKGDPWASKRVNDVYKSIRHNFDWMIYVDMDEFIVTKQNLSKTIKQELETTFSSAICILIPWVMMSCNSIEKNPASLLETNVYRWNHDRKHENTKTNDPKFRCRYERIEVKCIFKPGYFFDIEDHIPINPTTTTTLENVVNGLNNKRCPLVNAAYNLREKNIAEGYLLCYHYRNISIENCRDKIKNNCWYKHYTLPQIMSTDYNEIKDETLKLKSQLFRSQLNQKESFLVHNE